MRNRAWITSAIAFVAGACDGGKTNPDAGTILDAPTPDAPTPDAPMDPRVTVAEVPVTPNRDLDLLFVVDDSPSMLDKQTNLKGNFPSFIQQLTAATGGLPNLHLGVITTDMGTKASGSPTPGPAIGQIGLGGCSGTGKGGALQIYSAPVTGRFVVDVEAAGGGRTRNYTGTLEDAFRAMASAGTGGCGFEQPLAAMRAALDNNPQNAGFLRPNAILGVVLLTDEDDCSAKSTTLFGPESMTVGSLSSFRCTRFGVTCTTGGQTPDEMNQPGAKSGCGANASSALVDDVAPYRDFLRGLKNDGRRVVVGGILGDPQPMAVELRAPPGGGTPIPQLAHSCTYAGPMGTEVADPAARLIGFLDQFPDRSSATTICSMSFGLELLSEHLRRVMVGSSCVAESQLADTDPGRPGVQPDCVVEDVVGAVEMPMASCEVNPAALPCWRLEPDAVTCGSSPAPNLKLVVQRGATPDPATVTRLRCRVQP